VKVNRRFGGTSLSLQLALLAACFMLVSCLAYSSTLKTEATSEMSADYRRTKLRYISEDRPLEKGEISNVF
jgi:hypothetical protein